MTEERCNGVIMGGCNRAQVMWSGEGGGRGEM